MTAMLTRASFKCKALTVWIVLSIVTSGSNVGHPRSLDIKTVTSLFVTSLSIK